MELTTKFNPGDMVWTMYENKPHQFKIAKIEVTARPSYRNDGTMHPLPTCTEFYIEEKNTLTRNNPVTVRHAWFNCYATKEELIKKIMEE
jgi:hypothetical protein